TYSGAGTWRLDMVTIAGEIFTDNAFPVISTITNITLRANTQSDLLPFTIGDVETAADQLIVSATSSDTLLIPNENIFLAGSGSNRAVQVLPAPDQSGVATITVTVTDEAGKFTSATFRVTVLPLNTPPTLSVFTNYHTVVNVTLAPISFTIGDAESAANTLTVMTSSSNPTVIPDANVVFGGAGANRTLTITPAAGQTGNAVITVTVSDGTLTTSRSFSVMVVPSIAVLLCEPFSYADGSVSTNSGFLWSNHSGIAGQTQVSVGELRLTSAQTEDINAVLIGAPHQPTNAAKLYAAFTINFQVLPSGLGEYFGHFREIGGAFRARVYATTTNVTLGSFRLGIANTSGSITNVEIFPLDLNLQTKYVVVVRYDVGSGSSSLWVNPASEADVPAVAFDPADPDAITSWAFRQSSSATGSMGTLQVDDLKVATSFADALPGYRLRAERVGTSIKISWPAVATDEGYVLESTSNLTAPGWQTVVDVPMRVGGRDEVTVTAPTGTRFYRLIK
ncbi:MAG: Ig-like domain-containing protein, partial [Phycisphaerales bacterium]|nr:Ig-like domain-containing protein [Phycisphaerales bacterium]